jgi:hypothetical protein
MPERSGWPVLALQVLPASVLLNTPPHLSPAQARGDVPA